MIVFNCQVCDSPFQVTRHEAEKSVIEGAPLLCPECGSIYVLELTCVHEGHR